MTCTLSMSTGEQLELDCTVADAAKALENAARSSPGTLAWFEEATTGRPLGINPTRVVTVREAPSSGADSVA
jgi:hypothetical protein